MSTDEARAAIILDKYRLQDEAAGLIEQLPDGRQRCLACGQTSRVTKIGADIPLRKGLLEMVHTQDCPHTADLEARLRIVFPGYGR